MLVDKHDDVKTTANTMLRETDAFANELAHLGEIEVTAFPNSSVSNNYDSCRESCLVCVYLLTLQLLNFPGDSGSKRGEYGCLCNGLEHCTWTGKILKQGVDPYPQK